MPIRRRALKREQFWRDHIRQHQASGQTINAYYQAHQIKENHFYFWRRQITNRDQQSAALSAVPVDAPAQDSVPAFVPVAVVNASSSHETPIEIRLVNGHRLRVRSNCDLQLLEAVMNMLNKEAR